MGLAIGERTVRHATCERCGRSYDHVTGFVYDGGDAHSVYYAACHGHPEHDAWIDVVLGTWAEDESGDHVTFSCRLGQEGATAVDAPAAVEGRAGFFGRKLTREQALAHDRVATFWSVVDLVALEDETVTAHLGGGGSDASPSPPGSL